jgi:hypothetical protein
MAASSGVFAESIGGGGETGGAATGVVGKKTKTPAKKTKAPAKAKAKAPAKAKAKAPARKGKFTLEGAQVTTGDDIAWALVGFILVALLILI